MQSVMVCEIIRKLLIKNKSIDFPVQYTVIEFLAAVDEADHPKHMPNQLEPKHWDQFTKLRRQKLESDITIKGVNLKLFDVQNTYNRHSKNLNQLKNARSFALQKLETTKREYSELLKNHALLLTLTRGQMEVMFTPRTEGLKSSILMHVDDINDINAKIKDEGRKKLRAMQRVAIFRRQVIYKEWEHSVTRANINYLKYMLEVIEKIKTTREFLDVLREWDRIQQKRKAKKSIFEVGFDRIDQVVQQRIKAARISLEEYYEKIDNVKHKINMLRSENIGINKRIEMLRVDLSLTAVYRDQMREEKLVREQRERMNKIKTHRKLMETVRADYARILELKTILELQRLRTYPTLGPPPDDCLDREGGICL